MTNLIASFFTVVVFPLEWTEVVLLEMLNEMRPMAEEIPIIGKSRFKKPFDLSYIYLVNLKKREQKKYVVCRLICKLRSFLNRDSTVQF